MAVSSNPTPMWKGYKKVLGTSGGTFTYNIEDDEQNLIYAGVALPPPGSNIVSVELFDILAPYVCQEDLLETLRYSWMEDSIEKIASNINQHFVLNYSGPAVSSNAAVDVFGDYSYDYAEGERGGVLAAPVRSDAPNYGVIIFTLKYCPTGTLLVQRYRNGAWQTNTSITIDTACAYNIVLSAGVFVPGDKIRLKLPDNSVSLEYTIACSPNAGNYILYYVNAIGGWDFLEMRGVCRRTDTHDRALVDVVGDRVDGEGFFNAGSRVFRTMGVARWELNTGILTDEQARRVAKHLFGTTRAVLQVDGNFYPVQITDTEATYKTASSNGRVPASYTIGVQALQDLVRV